MVDGGFFPGVAESVFLCLLYGELLTGLRAAAEEGNLVGYTGWLLLLMALEGRTDQASTSRRGGAKKISCVWSNVKPKSTQTGQGFF
jgi:hypothetical protein